MIILAIDTSGPVAGVSVWCDGAIRYEAAAVNKMTHSENIMPMVEEALLRAGVTKEQLTLLAVTVGPGSFTGVRIGVTAVKALSHALGIPCVAVDALEATAAGLEAQDEIVCPIQDARVQQVYGAAFCNGKRLLDDCVLKLPEYLDKISLLGERFLFTGRRRSRIPAADCRLPGRSRALCRRALRLSAPRRRGCPGRARCGQGGGLSDASAPVSARAAGRARARRAGGQAAWLISPCAA